MGLWRLWDKHDRALSIEVRHILLSGEYVWEQLDTASVEDWAPPAIQYCRALEHELRRRLQVPIKGHWTIGSPYHLYLNREYPDPKRSTALVWHRLSRHATASGCEERDFVRFLKRIEAEIRQRRNELAHGDPVPVMNAEALRVSVLGQSTTVGLLRWLVEHIDPLG